MPGAAGPDTAALVVLGSGAAGLDAPDTVGLDALDMAALGALDMAGLDALVSVPVTVMEGLGSGTMHGGQEARLRQARR